MKWRQVQKINFFSKKVHESSYENEKKNDYLIAIMMSRNSLTNKNSIIAVCREENQKQDHYKANIAHSITLNTRENLQVCQFARIAESSSIDGSYYIRAKASVELAENISSIKYHLKMIYCTLL